MGNNILHIMHRIAQDCDDGGVSVKEAVELMEEEIDAYEQFRCSVLKFHNCIIYEKCTTYYDNCLVVGTVEFDADAPQFILLDKNEYGRAVYRLSKKGGKENEN